MASDREQFRELVQRGDLKSAHVAQALMETGIAPDLSRWRAFIDNLLLWLGASSFAAGVLFFFAYNWETMSRFAKFGLIQALIVAAIAAYVFFQKSARTGSERLGKVSLFVATVLLGVLLALYGQTYQTGADPWELFAYWAMLALPWVWIACFAPLWLLFVGLLNVAWLAYTSTFGPELTGFAGVYETVALGLLLINSLALALWEWRMPHHDWMQDMWSPRLLTLAAIVPVTALASDAVTTTVDGAVVHGLIWLAFIAALIAFYRYRRADLFMLAGACFSGGCVVMAMLIEHLFSHSLGGGGKFLLAAVAIVAMGAGAAVWLRRTQNALFEEAQ